MPLSNLEESSTLFGQRVQDLMDSKGWKIKELSDALGITYEHVRKIVRGEATPSKTLVKLVATIFKVDEDELAKMASADQIEKKHGGVAFELAGKDPEVEPFERGFSKLTKQQKDILTSQLKTFLAQNRKHKLEKLQ